MPSIIACNPMYVGAYYANQMISAEVFGLDWREYEDFWGPRRSIEGYWQSSGYEVYTFTTLPPSNPEISKEKSDAFIKRCRNDWKCKVTNLPNGGISIKRRLIFRIIDKVKFIYFQRSRGD